MRMTLESTGFVVKAKQKEDDPESFAIDCRLWQGMTEKGVPVCCLIARIAVSSCADQTEFERDLAEVFPPVTTANVFPLRMVI